MSSVQKAWGHKFTVICPQKNCDYTSRHWLVKSPFKISHKESSYSLKCPVHQLTLIPLKTKTK